MESQMEQLSLEDDEWEREQGIPLPSDPFIQKYFTGVEALLEQENKHRSDRDFRELLSPMAREACAITAQIRFEEQQNIWTPDFEDKLAEETPREVYPGMMFYLAKSRLYQTKLWKIMRKMPKGALLHCHLEAMVDQHWIFTEAFNLENLHFHSSHSLESEEKRNTAVFGFAYKKDPQPSSPSVWDASYVAETPIPYVTVADSFPHGGREGFIQWMISRCSISADEAHSHHLGGNQIWAKFISCFGLLRSLVNYEPMYRKFINRMLTQLADDGVQWVDLRAVLSAFVKDRSETPEEGFVEQFRVLGEEIEKFKASEQGKNFWGARMIWTAVRAFSNRAIAESMKHCIATKIAHPHLIAGFDLVGHEDPGRSLADLTPVLFWFRKQCAQAGVNIPFFFHAGETNGSGTEADINLFDAVSLGTRRLGHAFSLYKHPLLMNLVKDKRICVECCPISNEILRLTSSILAHPLPALLAQGVSVALSNDDPAMLGQYTAGMSHDFYQAIQGIESLGLEGLGALAENSVRWAAFEDLGPKEWTEDVKNGMYGSGIRAKRMKEWRKQWEQFCMEIVMEFGPDMDTEEPLPAEQEPTA